VALELTTLTDGGQAPAEVAREVAAFVHATRESLDLALYDLRVEGSSGALVLAALLDAQQRGVAVRLLFDVDHPGPIPVPPPPESTPDAIEALPVATRGVAGVPNLMHHKFAVRDGVDVWAGSTNWTEDSWSRQENVIVRVLGAQGIARAYGIAFDQLWESGTVEGAGQVEPRPVEVDGRELRAWFCPGYGEALSHRIAKYVGRAGDRIRIASPVLTSGPILGTLVEIVKERRCDLAGVVDATQVAEVFYQWRTNGVSAWKIPLLSQVLEGAPISGKPSTPWSPTALHDFMHAKVVVADDVAFVGSFNLSRSGERNAEDVLEIHDAGTADRLAAFVDEVRARYPRAAAPFDRQPADLLDPRAPETTRHLERPLDLDVKLSRARAGTGSKVTVPCRPRCPRRSWWPCSRPSRRR
jgi:phosphatidylserine/phosphatidylglycerophosphate/cardiolipin synthase-like enzyme